MASESNGRPLTAGELYAAAQGHSCEGPDECHWCGAPCERAFPHDDPPALFIGVKRVYSRRPGNGFICVGCQLWRRKRVTVEFLGGGYKDGQSAENWGWYVAGPRARALRPFDPLDREALYERLLDPPPRFFLAVKDTQPTLLQHVVVNDLKDPAAATPIYFTLDNKPLSYTVYELEHALLNGPAGTEPGVQLLLKIFGVPPAPEPTPEGPPPKAEPKKGRPFAPRAEDNPANRKLRDAPKTSAGGKG